MFADLFVGTRETVVESNTFCEDVRLTLRETIDSLTQRIDG